MQPDVFICADDFGVAPELLTTAQKVAILESQAFQNKNFKPVLPPTATSPLPQPYYRSNSLSVELQQQQEQPYVPTGLRMKTETLDAAAQDITLDGGPVAKTTDKLSDKVCVSSSPPHMLNGSIQCNTPTLSPLFPMYL